MIQKLAVALALVGLLAWSGYEGWIRSTRRTGYPAPDFELRDLSGTVHRLSAYQGKVIFLNLWATWCPPCRDEMPSMQRLATRLAGDDFVMIAVSEDVEASLVTKFASDLGLSFPILLDPTGRVASMYGTTGFPETFIIDRAGKVIHHIIGPEQWDSAASFAFFDKLIHAAP